MAPENSSNPPGRRAGSEPKGAEAAEGKQVTLAVRGGQVIAVVPAGTPETAIIGAASSIRGALRLENERVLTFEIHDAASSATFADQVARLHGVSQPATTGAPVGEQPGSITELGTASNIMTTEVLTASPDELVEDIAKRLAYHNITGLPVEDWDGTVIGIVSELDVIGKIGETIRDVMTPEVISVPPEMPVDQVATLMTGQRIKRVPVLEDGRVVGIVSRADIVRALAGQPRKA